MVLITGASGITGRSVIERARNGAFLWGACVHSERRIEELLVLGATEVVAMILSNPAPHDGATYELCGPQNLSRAEMQASFEAALGHSIEMRFLEDEMLLHGLEAQGVSDYRKQGMLTMFRHYNNQDFTGSDVTLSALLGRTPTTLVEYVRERIGTERF